MNLIERAPAKINLGLDTTYLHVDGFNDWQMVMTSIDLSDLIEIEPIEDSSKIQIECDSGFLPENHHNLAFRAAKLLQIKYQINRGVLIKIKKRIPVSAGLGGGSTDAAAVLRGLNHLWNLNLSYQQLATLSLSLDSDVPYCIFGQTAKVLGKGDQIELLPRLMPLWVVAIKPKISVSTPEILQKIDYQNLHHLKIDRLIDGIKKQNLSEIYDQMGNVLEPITALSFPEILKYKQRMFHYGAKVAQMSGTGPTMFSLFQSRRQAQRLLNSLKGFCDEVYLIHSL